MANDILKDGIPAIIEAADRGRAPEVIDVGEDLGIVAPMLLRPVAGGGYQVEGVKATIDAYRVRPARRIGTAKLTTLDSFIDHAMRFQDSGSAIFIDDNPAAPGFLSVLNYHDPVNVEAPAGPVAKAGDPPAETMHVEGDALPRFGDHRGSYTPAFSDEWKLWTGSDGKQLEQSAFGALVERGARCILTVEDHPEGEERKGPNPLSEGAEWFAKRFGRRFTPAQFFGSADTMGELAQGLVANVEETIGEVNVRGSMRSITFTSKTSSETVTVPLAFLLSIPVFKGGDPWQVPCRLSYKPVTKGEIRVFEWKIEMWQPNETIKACLADMGETVKARTKLPFFFGAPE